MPSSVSEIPLIRYRVRFYLPGALWLVPHEIMAVSLDAVWEWAEDRYDPSWEAEVYDITPLG